MGLEQMGMIDWIRVIKDVLTYIVAIGGAIVAIGGAIVAIGGAIVAIKTWVMKPIRRQMAMDEEQTQKISQLIEKVDALEQRVEANQAEFVHDRLQTLHERHCYELGWCSATEKSRIIDWYKDYHAKGYNHLVDTYVDDIARLPEKPVSR